MERLDGHDDLTARLARIDPAAGVAPLTEGALERVTRHAMTPAPKPWTWERYRLATLGALVGSGTIVVAGILGIQALAPELPVLALGTAHPTGKVPGPEGQGVRGMMIPYLTYDFTASPTLSSSQGSPVSYQLVSSVDAATAAAQLARLFGVDGDVTMPSDGYYQVGPDDGPNVTTWTSDGVVGWSYESATSSWATATPSDPSTTDDTTTTTTQPDASLPSDAQASSDAVALLVRAGIDAGSLGTPSVDSSSGTEVDVTVPLVVDGYATDQSFYVAYGHDGVLLDAGGNLATPTAESAYPTISPASAVNVLITDHGFVYYGGIEPMAMSPLAGATSPGAGSSSVLGPPADQVAPGPSDTTDTTLPGDVPTTTDGPPVVNVEIDQATMQLGTYTLADGTTWLLATWALSGPESGVTVTQPATYSANVLAVDPTYVQLAPRAINY